uniref:Uncharacterized protein n=1 Tax=Xiphophorus couchianus TaxID=32473 RepID=A0A3B5KRR0_9TELE
AQSHHQDDDHRDDHGVAQPPLTAGLQAVGHRPVPVTGDAAQQEDADVHVGEEDVARQLADRRAPSPFVTVVDVVRPERQREQVGQVAQRQAPQVDTKNVLSAHLLPGEEESQHVGGKTDDQNDDVENQQRQPVVAVRPLTAD